MKRVLLVLIAALVFAAPAAPVTQHRALNQVATIFAQRPVKALCYTPTEDNSPASFGAWGYVNIPLAKSRAMHLDALVCAGALAVNDSSLPAWQRALGVGVLTHEAYHLRHWGAARSEAKVECQAIRHWKISARLLGATEVTVAELWPYALAKHYELTNYRDVWGGGERPYYDPACEVPRLFEEPNEG